MITEYHSRPTGGKESIYELFACETTIMIVIILSENIQDTWFALVKPVAELKKK